MIDPKKVRAAALMINAGITMLALIVIGYYVGGKLDQKFHSEPYGMMVGICSGMALGLWGMIASAKRISP